jgi:hypothetical protein
MLYRFSRLRSKSVYFELSQDGKLCRYGLYLTHPTVSCLHSWMHFCNSSDICVFIVSGCVGSNLNVIYDVVAFVCFSVLLPSVVYGNFKMPQGAEVYCPQRLSKFFVTVLLSSERPYRFVVLAETMGAGQEDERIMRVENEPLLATIR